MKVIASLLYFSEVVFYDRFFLVEICMRVSAIHVISAITQQLVYQCSNITLKANTKVGNS